MKARILDQSALRAINPTALRAYLVYEGWVRVEPYGQFSEVYARPKSSEELIIPASTEIADYAAAIATALRFIAEYEDRDELALYADLIRADRDVIRVRAPDADDDGSISVDPGVEIVQHARDMLASAACSAVEPRQAYHLGKVQQAESYMRRVRLGQTEHGSFVITLLAPIPPVLSPSKQASFWPNLEQEPFDRQVTRVLTQALHSAQDAIVESNRGDGLSAFVDAVSKGVSANLCEAVASIVDRAAGADFSVTWARTRPAPVPRVTDLHRAEDQADGRVTIKAIVDGRPRSLSGNLSQSDYGTAIRAHGKQLPVTLVGDLEREGQRWRLIEPRDIRIIEDE
jgi:hypothetical protein